MLRHPTNLDDNRTRAYCVVYVIMGFIWNLSYLSVGEID